MINRCLNLKLGHLNQNPSKTEQNHNSYKNRKTKKKKKSPDNQKPCNGFETEICNDINAILAKIHWQRPSQYLWCETVWSKSKCGYHPGINAQCDST